VFTYSIYIAYTLYKLHLHRRSQRGRGPWPLQIFRISSHFVLSEAVSQTKYCCSPKIKHFDPSKNLGWPCHCARKYLNFCFIWVRLGFSWTKDD